MSNKILIVAGMQCWPPNVGGTPTVMYNLFKGLDHKKFDVLTGYRKDLKKDDRNLKNKIFYFPNSKLDEYRFIWRLSFIENIIRYICFGYRLVKQKTYYKKFFITFPETSSLIGGYILSKILHLKFDIYLLDLLSESRTHISEKYILRFFQKRVLSEADNVFCVEGLRDYYRKYVNREYVLLNHCISDNYNIRTSDYKKNTIIYAGQIHGISLDALQILVKAISLNSKNNISVKIYSNIDYEQLKEYKLDADFVDFGFMKNHDELLNQLALSEILFSPVAFYPVYPDQALTCFPTKTFDYIIAGRPILLHAPKNYFYTRYMKKYDSAFISTSDDPIDLLNDINNIINNPVLQEHIVKNAIKLLEKQHLRSQVQRILLNTIAN